MITITRSRRPQADPAVSEAPAPPKKVMQNGSAPSDAPVKSTLMTLIEVAALLKVSVKTVRRQIKTLEVPVVFVGRQVRLRCEHIVLFMRTRW